jgi:hypothetical protein
MDTFESTFNKHKKLLREHFQLNESAEMGSGVCEKRY